MAKACTVNSVAPSHTSLGSSADASEILMAREGSCLRLLSLTTPATRCPHASRSFLTSFSSSPPVGMGPTTPSTTGRGIGAPIGIARGSLSRRASLLCWASVAHPMSHFPEGSGLMEPLLPQRCTAAGCGAMVRASRTWPIRSPKSWITIGKSTNAGVRVFC